MCSQRLVRNNFFSHFYTLFMMLLLLNYMLHVAQYLMVLYTFYYANVIYERCCCFTIYTKDFF